MEKIRRHGKNEMHNEYFAVLKEKLDEIVDFVNGSADDTAVDEVVDIDEEDENG